MKFPQLKKYAFEKRTIKMAQNADTGTLKFCKKWFFVINLLSKETLFTTHNKQIASVMLPHH
ncbi:hypothetical protein [Mariniflexile sp.]|uniref:hypothetical protein n=1 Tax=Mariniflexile sp. TaxID=1979402 RepID=UPI0040478B08